MTTKSKKKPKPRNPARQAKILAAALELEAKFKKYKWFDGIGVGTTSESRKTHLFIKSKDAPPSKRTWMCTEHNGFPVIICGPWPK